VAVAVVAGSKDIGNVPYNGYAPAANG